MRILHVIDTLGSGGKERRLVELMRSMVPSRHVECELAILSNVVHYEEVLSLPIKVHRLVRRTRKDPFVLLHLLRVARAFSPDVIHVWDSMSAIYATPVAKFIRSKLVNGMITDADPEVRPFTKLFIRSRLTFPFSDAVVANSWAGAKAYGAPPLKSRVVHNGFDMERVTQIEPPDTIRTKFGICTCAVVGMVASFSRWKDYSTFLLAAQKMLAKRDDVTFVCVGDGPNLETSKSLVAAEFSHRILFLGKQHNVEPIVNVFTVGVLSTFTEGISNSIMEYMACAKPVVATDGGGTSELVVDGITGFLTPPRNEDDLMDKILLLLDNSSLAESMGQAGRSRLRGEFSMTKMVDGFCQLYDEILFA